MERIRPTINSVLFVSEADLETIKHWPLELRVIFDPQATRELAERAEQTRQAAEERAAQVRTKYGDEIPF